MELFNFTLARCYVIFSDIQNAINIYLNLIRIHIINDTISYILCITLES